MTGTPKSLKLEEDGAPTSSKPKVPKKKKESKPASTLSDLADSINDELAQEEPELSELPESNDPEEWASFLEAEGLTDLDDEDVEIFGVEAAGKGLNSNLHAASLTAGSPGVLHGNRTYLLQDDDGQIIDAHSISAGLDYPGIGPEHSWLHDIGRIKYLSTTDEESLAAFKLCSSLEGIIPALEPAHALHITGKLASERKGQIIIMNMCGRGDKDLSTVLPLIMKNSS